MTLINDHHQNYKGYGIQPAQLMIADIPYNIGINAYGSNPMWYVGGDNKNGESELAGKTFFRTDENFKPAEFMHFCQKMIRKEPKERNEAPAMLVFCSFEQQYMLIELAKKYGFMNYINLVFRKKYSAQVLKANMRIVGNAEYGLVLYREKLPKFRNDGKMVFNVMDWEDDPDTDLYRKIHPTQKPIRLLERLISIFTDEGDVVIDPVAGSGSTIIAAENLGRKAYGFEIDKQFYRQATDWIQEWRVAREELKRDGYSISMLRKLNPEQGVLFA